MTESLELPTPNLPLLRKVLEHIDAHPQEWHQDTWGTDHAYTDSRGNIAIDQNRPVEACHTAYCVAGHALVLDGTHKLGFKAGSLIVIDGDLSPRQAAQELLGLTDGEAAALFWYGNSRETVQVLATQIADRAGEVL